MEILAPLFFFSPGFMPIVMSWIFKYFKLKQSWITYSITFLNAFFIMALCIYAIIDDRGEYDDPIPFSAYIAMFFISLFAISFSLLIQWYFNKLWFVGEVE
jgi:hypothetical protein